MVSYHYRMDLEGSDQERVGVQGCFRTTFAGHAELCCHVDVALFIDGAISSDGFDVHRRRIIVFPGHAAEYQVSGGFGRGVCSARHSPVHATNPRGAGCGSPLVEAGFVDVVPACGAAPDYRFVVLEFHEADRTVSLQWLPVTAIVFDGDGLPFAERRALVYFTEFLRRTFRVRHLFELVSSSVVWSQLTEDRKASWYWRWLGALRAFTRTSKAINMIRITNDERNKNRGLIGSYVEVVCHEP